MLRKIISIDWLSRCRCEHQVIAQGHKLLALAFICRSRSSATIQRCDLIGLRLRERFESQKHYSPFSLRMLRTTLTICRVQSMSCHFRPAYSLGRIPVVECYRQAVHHTECPECDLCPLPNRGLGRVRATFSSSMLALPVWDRGSFDCVVPFPCFMIAA